MKYRSDITKYCRFYIVFAIVCAVYWLYVNGESIGKNIDINRLSALVGINNGYSYQWFLATILLLGYIFIVNKGMNFTSVAYVTRISRDEIVRRNLIGVIVNASCYVTIYILVEISFIIMNTDMQTLLKADFFMAMLLFGITLTTVYVVMGILYILINLIADNSYLALVILFVVNILIVFAESYLYIDVLRIYTNVGILDELVSGADVKLFQWMITTVMQILLACILCLFVKKRYCRKDIIGRDVKK